MLLFAGILAGFLTGAITTYILTGERIINNWLEKNISFGYLSFKLEYYEIRKVRREDE